MIERYFPYMILIGPVFIIAGVLTNTLEITLILLMIGFGIFLCGIYWTFVEVKNEYKKAKR